MTKKWRIESDEQGYWLFKGEEKKAMLYGFYNDWIPIVHLLNESERPERLIDALYSIKSEICDTQFTGNTAQEARKEMRSLLDYVESFIQEEK